MTKVCDEERIVFWEYKRFEDRVGFGEWNVLLVLGIIGEEVFVFNLVLFWGFSLFVSVGRKRSSWFGEKVCIVGEGIGWKRIRWNLGERFEF